MTQIMAMSISLPALTGSLIMESLDDEFSE